MKVELSLEWVLMDLVVVSIVVFVALVSSMFTPFMGFSRGGLTFQFVLKNL